MLSINTFAWEAGLSKSLSFADWASREPQARNSKFQRFITCKMKCEHRVSSYSLLFFSPSFWLWVCFPFQPTPGSQNQETGHFQGIVNINMEQLSPPCLAQTANHPGFTETYVDCVIVFVVVTVCQLKKQIVNNILHSLLQLVFIKWTNLWKVML